MLYYFPFQMEGKTMYFTTFPLSFPDCMQIAVVVVLFCLGLYCVLWAFGYQMLKSNGYTRPKTLYRFAIQGTLTALGAIVAVLGFMLIGTIFLSLPRQFVLLALLCLWLLLPIMVKIFCLLKISVRQMLNEWLYLKPQQSSYEM